MTKIAEAAANPGEVIADAQDMLSEVVAGLLVRSGPAVVQIALHGAGIDRNDSEQINATLNAMTGGSWSASVGDALGGLGLDALEGHLVELVELLERWSGNLKALVAEATTVAQSHLSNLESFDALVQRSAAGDGSMAVDAASEQAMAASQGQRLEPAVQAEMEQRFGADFSQVRVHTDSHAAKASDRLQANAMARGRDVYFAAGKYDPQSTQGKRLLAHELAHTVQDGAAPKKQAGAPASEASQGVRRKARTSAPGDATERQADAAADQVVGGQQVTALGGGGGQAGAVKRQESELAGQFATELTDLGKTIGGWEALLEELSKTKGADLGKLIKSFKTSFGSKQHGMAFVEPLMREPRGAVADWVNVFNQHDVHFETVTVRFGDQLRPNRIDDQSPLPQVMRVPASLLTTYAAASALRWLHNGLKAEEFDALLGRRRGRPADARALQALGDKLGELGEWLATKNFTPGGVRIDGDQCELSWDVDVARDVDEHIATNLVAVQREHWSEWVASVETDYAAELGRAGVLSDEPRCSARAQAVLARVRPRVLGLLKQGELDHGVGAMLGPQATSSALRNEAWQMLLRLMAADLREQLAQGALADSGADFDTLIEVQGKGQWRLEVGLRAGVVEEVGELVDSRLEQFDREVVEEQVAGFQGSYPDVLGRVSFDVEGQARSLRVEAAVLSAVVDQRDLSNARLDHHARSVKPLRQALFGALGVALTDAIEARIDTAQRDADAELAGQASRYEVMYNPRAGAAFICGVEPSEHKGERAGKRVHPALKAAIAKEGIIGFLRRMAADKAVRVSFEDDGGTSASMRVTRSRFANPQDVLGFEHTDSQDGKLHNKAYIKDKFRAADAGKHEWVPSDQILTVVLRSGPNKTADEIADGGVWLETQDKLRSHTEDLIFNPYIQAHEFGQFGLKVQEWAAGLSEMLRDLSKDPVDGGIAPEDVDPEELTFQGHVGALYRDVGKSDAKQQTVGEAAWHEVLRGKFAQAGSVNDAVSTMHQFAERTVWNGVFDPALSADVLVQVKVDFVNASKKALPIDHVEGDSTASDRRQEIFEEKVAKPIRDQVGELDETISTLLGLSERQKVAFKRVGEDFAQAQTEVDANE